jgi:putative methionine-R-sulfoxide reductase with GAF domain
LDSKRLLIVALDGLYVYDKNKKKIKKLTVAECPLMAGFLDYPANRCSFFQPKAGSFVILKAESDRITYVNIGQNKKVVSRLPFTPRAIDFHWRARLFVESDSLFYLTGHEAGFYKLKLDTNSGKLEMDPVKYFETYQCNAILKDRTGNTWIATKKGLFRQDKGRSQVELAFIPGSVTNSFPNNVINEVFVSGDKIYAGTGNPASLLLYDQKTMNFIRTADLDPPGKKAEGSYNIFAIQDLGPSELLIATDGRLLRTSVEATAQQEVVPPRWHRSYDWTKDLFKDSRGNIWIGSTLVYWYSIKEKTFEFIPWEEQLRSQIQQPSAIREDADGNMWMAGHGLTRFNWLLKRYDIRLDSFPFIKMADKQVNNMVIDKRKNIIWFNSVNNGLLSYDIGMHKFRHFTTRDGVPDNTINALTIVNNSLWMAGLSRIASMDLDTYQVTGYSSEDGFPDRTENNWGNFFYDTSSRLLYFAFSNAIARFDPAKMTGKKTAPDVFIENLAFPDQKNIFLPGDMITTSWKKNDIRLTIGAINFSNAGSQHFAFRLVKDSATPWIDLGDQPTFNISNLSPGRQHLQVKVFSVTNRWPEQVKEMEIRVLPPLWMENWFIVITSVLVVGLIYWFIRWQTRVARHKEMEKTNIEKLKADDYKAQFELEQITNYFSSSLAGKNTEEDVLWDVSANLIGRMKYEDCIIYLWNEDKTRMVQKAAYGPKGKPEVISKDAFEVAPGQGIVGHVIQTRQPILVKDTRLDLRYRVDDEFRLSELAVPIIYNDELLGVIDSENRQLGYYSERDIKMLTTIATLTGNKLKEISSQQSLEAKQRELAGINEQLAGARLSALQAQMNPHFVFNALNSIKRMILDCDNEKASRYLSKFALMIRMTLEHSKELFVTLDENIEYLEAYLEMERLRFDDSFTYCICTDPDVDVSEILLPSMMIQPLVENAIWHGLMQAGADKKIRVHFSQAHNNIICMVEDNGIGIRRAEVLRAQHRPLHLPVGLQNLQNRINIMNEKYGTDCSLRITDLAEEEAGRHGTRAILQLRIINA